MATSVPFAVRGSVGISIHQGPPLYKILENFTPISTKASRKIEFSPCGRYFAVVYSQLIRIVRTNNWQDAAVIEQSKAYHIAFSPKGTYLMTWEPFTVSNANPEGSPNLKIFKSETGELVQSFVHKKQTNWEPVWSADEVLFSRLVNDAVVFFEGGNFEKVVCRLNSFKVASYTISPTLNTYYILCHTPGSKGQPSFGRMFKYPNLNAQQVIASKSFFQSDKVEFYWDSKGANALLLASTEVDKTGGSYYGKQTLHFMGVNGQTAMVPMGKEGPIYSVTWSPKSPEFCVVYGFTPAKATIYNLKCESVFELGTGPRNIAKYNGHGNILLLGGFGNLRGQIELWDMKSRKIIGTCAAPDTTYIEWCPDGVHFLTATTAPRLRIGNGFKVWHYSGSLLHEKSESEEVYEVLWQSLPVGEFKEPVISGSKVEGIAPSQPQASKQAYRPPSARNKEITFNLHDDEELAYKPGKESQPSKAALQQRKKREARKARKAEEGEEKLEVKPASTIDVTLTGDAEKDKKIKNLKKKLDAIQKLKQQQESGKTLEVNQLAKIKGEADLLKELEQLQI